MEILGAEHMVTTENVVLDEINSKALLANLGVDLKILDSDTTLNNFVELNKFDFEKDILRIINDASRFKIKDKAGDFIGTRMGRPEKAKLRKLQGSPNVLFPIGSEGGRMRSLQTACEVGKVRAEFPIYKCENCGKETIYKVCENCGKETKKLFYFYDTQEKKTTKYCPSSEREGTPYCRMDLDINHYFDKAVEKLEMEENEIPLLVKGVRGLSSGEKQMEHLAKGLLRAKYDLQVNKDGTIRFDATELPLIAFKPVEIGVSIEKLKELGYDKDIHGKDLV